MAEEAMGWQSCGGMINELMKNRGAWIVGILGCCLLESFLSCRITFLCDVRLFLISHQFIVFMCLGFCLACFQFLTFEIRDLLLMFTMVVGMLWACFYNGHESLIDGITLAGAALVGKCCKIILFSGRTSSKIAKDIRDFLMGLAVLLTFLSFWHLNGGEGIYCGPRWMSIWPNPNLFGVLMAMGGVLAGGLLLNELEYTSFDLKFFNEFKNNRTEGGNSRTRFQPRIILLSGILVLLLVGLLFSYSRGAWFGMACGFLYLERAAMRLKALHLLSVGLALVVVIWFLWNSTADVAPWYVKRLDFGRPSVQHRISAWSGGLQIIRDHPFGVGWDRSIMVYEREYTPPENGAAALATNDYLMLGTQIGLPALICFALYLLLVSGMANLKRRSRQLELSEITKVKIICRAGVVVCFVAFWFDGGLFNLATASVFWSLLEVGCE